MKVFRQFRFHAARHLPNLDDSHICKQIHGHTFNLIIYISGEIVSYSLDKDLILEGYSITRLVNYTVIQTKEIREEFIKDLKSFIPDMVFIYSENSARSFLNILKKYNLNDVWMQTNLMCLGEGASSVLNEIKWKKIFLFNPGEEEFLLYKI